MRGFTLAEVVVVAGIIAVVSTVLIVGQNSFNRTILLTNTATDVALSLRNAQVYGISSRSAGAVKNANYGVSFTLGSSFIFFADTHTAAVSTKPTDKPGNGYYTATDNLFAQTFTLNNGMTVTHFCATTVMSAQRCDNSSGVDAMQRLAIVFGRPNTSAKFIVNKVDGTAVSNVAGDAFVKACLVVSSQQGTSRAIEVTQFGEIISNSTTTCL